MNIIWTKSEPYEWTGTDEYINYVLVVTQPNHPFKGCWHWKVFKDEDKIIDGDFEEDFAAFTAYDAKLRAENALDNYLSERNNLNNILSEAMADEERIEREDYTMNENERLEYKNDKP